MYIIRIRNGETENVLHEMSMNSVRRAAAFKFQRGINEKQQATVTVYPQNPVYNDIFEKKTILEIVNTHTNECDFEGFVDEIRDNGMNDDGVVGKQLYCEGYLSYLEETIQPYISYGQNMPVSQFLTYLLYRHNQYTDDAHKIELGACDVAETGAFVTEYNSTFEEIQRNLINNFGGEIQVRRRSDGVLVLDYLTRIGVAKDTKVELAENMVALNVSNDTSGIVTRLFPLGPTLNDNTGERMTIESINDGKPYIDSAEGIETYGIIQSTVDYSGDGDFDTLASLEKELADDTKQKESAEQNRAETIIKRDQATSEAQRQKYNQKIAELDAQISAYTARITELTDTLIPAARTTALTSIKAKAEQYLANNCRIKKSYRAVVLDLSTIGEDADSFREGNTYRFINRLIPIDENLRVMRVAIDGYKPYSPTVEIGDKAETITQIATRSVRLMEYELPKQMNEVLETAKETATSLIKSATNGYVVFNDSDNDGVPDEILIMDAPTTDAAISVWRWNRNGLGYSNTGYNGTYGLAMTIDGAIVADFITAGVLRGIEITNGNGTFHVTPTGQVSCSSVAITGGSFNINNVFTVDASGNCVANSFSSNNASITGGSLSVSGAYGSIDIRNGIITFKNAQGNDVLRLYGNGTYSFWDDNAGRWISSSYAAVEHSLDGLSASISDLQTRVTILEQKVGD